jgi:Cys/Met metabolism PLP-dependent enzyme
MLHPRWVWPFVYLMICSRDIQYYADKVRGSTLSKMYTSSTILYSFFFQVHAVGGRLVVDSTFAPPPLQYPFKWGADIIMHSGL